MPDPAANLPEYSVSEIAGAIKRTVEERFGLVRVRGEISGWKRAASGHAYLCLKDDAALIDGVMWKGALGQLGFRPEDGLDVVATGRLTTYPGRSKYQLVIERMEPAGVGALMALLEARRKALAAEGLFATERKRPLPWLPETIGVITSPTGAVIRDILHRLAERFPRHVLVWPVAVQGEPAASQIAAAIAGFNALPPGGPRPRPDLLIVARGGGSIEDLWAFNEEVVVRAVAASAIPLISAVGHETDTTLIDLAADRRAPTPTAAAEMAVPVRAELALTLEDMESRLARAVLRGLADRRERLAGLARGLPHPRHLVGLAQQRHDELADRLPRALGHVMAGWRARAENAGARLHVGALTQRLGFEAERLAALCARLDAAAARAPERGADRLAAVARMLETLSYQATLARGYALVRDAQGALVATARAAAGQSLLTLEFSDESLAVAPVGVAGARPRPAARPLAKAPDQGRLF